MQNQKSEPDFGGAGLHFDIVECQPRSPKTGFYNIFHFTRLFLCWSWSVSLRHQPPHPIQCCYAKMQFPLWKRTFTMSWTTLNGVRGGDRLAGYVSYASGLSAFSHQGQILALQGQNLALMGECRKTRCMARQSIFSMPTCGNFHKGPLASGFWAGFWLAFGWLFRVKARWLFSLYI